MKNDPKSPADFLADPDFRASLPASFTRGIVEPDGSPVLEEKKPVSKYLDDCLPPDPMSDSLAQGEPLHQFENLAKLRARYPFFEDRSVKPAFLSARCPFWLKDDFDFVCRVVEGEDPAVVLRRLAREYVRFNTPS